jgi:hypothetical protein
VFPIDALKMRNTSTTTFDPASLFGGTAGGYWDPSDKATMWKDTGGTSAVTADGDSVARIDDKSGNGNHLLQATAGFRPVFKDVAGIRYLLFDGSDDFMQVTFALGLTWSRVSGLLITAGANFLKQFFCGATVDEHLIDNGGGGAQMHNGTSGGPAVSYSTNTNYVFTELWDSPCQIAEDNGSYVNTPSIAAVNPGGLTVAAKSDGTAACGLRWHGTAMINRAFTGGEIASLRTFFGAKQGRSL